MTLADIEQPLADLEQAESGLRHLARDPDGLYVMDPQQRHQLEHAAELVKLAQTMLETAIGDGSGNKG